MLENRRRPSILESYLESENCCTGQTIFHPKKHDNWVYILKTMKNTCSCYGHSKTSQFIVCEGQLPVSIYSSFSESFTSSFLACWQILWFFKLLIFLQNWSLSKKRTWVKFPAKNAGAPDAPWTLTPHVRSGNERDNARLRVKDAKFITKATKLVPNSSSWQTTCNGLGVPRHFDAEIYSKKLTVSIRRINRGRWQFYLKNMRVSL